jgi:glycosyltransferase involved in cell wall biosynthesis
MPAGRPPYYVSIIVEWENATRIGAARARRMFEALERQMADIPRDLASGFEVILVREEGAEAAADVPALANARLLLAPTGQYYAQKNFGAAAATGDILLFIDSDVVPFPGWMEGILGVFRDPDATVVCGATSVDHDSLYSKAMALGWIFPLPPGEEEGLAEVPGYFANNVAFRREVFAAHNYPDVREYRGHGVYVFDSLRRAGHRILRNPKARVGHPPPEPKRFFARALWSGFDAAARQEEDGRRAWPRKAKGVLGHAAFGLYRVWKGYRRVGLGAGGAIGAGAIVAVYQGLRVMGFLASSVAPRPMWRLLRRLHP